MIFQLAMSDYQRVVGVVRLVFYENLMNCKPPTRYKLVISRYKPISL